MTRRISLIIGVAVIALTVVVPAAFGAGRYPGSQQRSDFWNYQSNAKVADSSPGVAQQDLATLFAGSGRGLGTNYAKGVSPDIVDMLVAKNGVVDSSVVDALGANREGPSTDIVDMLVAKNGVVDSSVVEALGANGGSPEVSTVDSGTEIEWPRVGIGLGIGILLVLGLGLTMRIAHVRPFAH
jgi:hypothetical protein